MNIIHISDLHFGTDADARNWASQLAEDLTRELNCSRLDAVIVSGDIATKAKPEEYTAAKIFFDALRSELGPDPEENPDGLVIVPGNHDLSYPLAKKGYSLTDRDDYEGDLDQVRHIAVDDSVIRVRDQEAAHQARFDPFSDFHRSVTGRPYPSEPESQGILHAFPEHRLLILGLNSAWDIDQFFPADASIHPLALSQTLGEIRKNADAYKDFQKFAVWHHPIDGPGEDRIRDRGPMDQLAKAGFSVVLHGHLHQSGTAIYPYDIDGNRRIQVIGGGTFGAPTKDWQPGVPLQYHFLTLTDNRLTVRTRCREKPNGAWDSASIYRQGPGQESISTYTVPLPEPSLPEIPPDSEDLPLQVPRRYREIILDHCRNMDIEHLRGTTDTLNVKLPEIFIPLYAHSPTRKAGPSADLLGGRETPSDIEDLIARHPCLVLKGQPGAGKTTLLKHVTLEILSGKAPESLDGYLPVLVLLTRLNPLRERWSDAQPCRTTAESILTAYLETVENGLDPATLWRYCERGKALLLLDGLDELDADLRALLVRSVADFRHFYPGCRIVLSGRPHGIDDPVKERFGDWLVEILSLTPEQVETFVNQWFCAVSAESRAACLKTAEEMLAEMQTHPDIEALKDTPLMLTAICLLYNDGKELPGQRAELYNRFVNNLLSRRFRGESEKVRQFLAELARAMHVNRVRALDRNDAIAPLVAVYDPDGRLNNGERRRLFDRIESNCGLLRLEGGQHRFWHLSFQAFLAAVSLVDGEAGDPFDVIKGFLEDDWYAEMIHLYVGYLSRDQRNRSNGIVRRLLTEPDEPPFRRWRTAGWCLENIHRDRRNLEPIELVQTRMPEVMTSEAKPAHRDDAGRVLGWIGDPRPLKAFVSVDGGPYQLSGGEVDIEGFQIGQYPVTNGWYREFIDAGGYRAERYWTENGKKWLAHTGTTHPRFWHDRQWNCPNTPVVGVCWYEAVAFTRWLTEIDPDGYRYFLPTETQWEAAASGPEGGDYPWGKDWREDHCNTKETGLGKTSPVGIFRKGETPSGIADLSGNIWEWTASDYHAEKRRDDFEFDPEIQKLYEEFVETTDEKRKEEIRDIVRSRWEEKDRQLSVLRGGSWYHDKGASRRGVRIRDFPSYRYNILGFRCARTNCPLSF